MKTSLTPLDWTVAGIAALAEGGVEAVRVERLAKRLGASKGSFYWHFADRPALLSAMLDLWEREGTDEVISHVIAITDPGVRLRSVVQQALETTTRGVNVAHAEAALRSWAAQDSKVAARFLAVEQARVDFLAATLAALGYDGTSALRLSKALYLALIGLYAARSYAPQLADDASLLDLVDRLIISGPDSGG